MDFQIPAADGRLLAATRIGHGPHLVVAGATGVKRGFYAEFAKHLSDRFTVTTFDYRGIGGSRDRPLRNDNATMADWGRLDLEGVLRDVGPGAVVVTHSVGGQILPLAPSARTIRKACLVASQSGHWRHWSPAWRPRLLLFWFVLIPVLTAVRGDFPSHWIGMGQPLPRGVARQWARWGRHRAYLLRDDANRAAYAKSTFPVRAIHVADDHDLAPRAAVEALASWYPDAHVVEHAPAAFGLHGIGHFGWFRGKPALWDDAAAWLA